MQVNVFLHIQRRCRIIGLSQDLAAVISRVHIFLLMLLKTCFERAIHLKNFKIFHIKKKKLNVLLFRKNALL